MSGIGGSGRGGRIEAHEHFVVYLSVLAFLMLVIKRFLLQEQTEECMFMRKSGSKWETQLI